MQSWLKKVSRVFVTTAIACTMTERLTLSPSIVLKSVLLVVADYLRTTKSLKLKKSSYSRNAFQHWIDEDKNCLNTRHELLKELSTGPITMDERGCRVIRGRWNDPYTNKIFYDGDKVDVDHLIPLKWAWENGADQWDADKRKQFANDPRNLFVVSASANRSKGAKGPHEWLPPYEKFHCQYLTRYLRVLMIYKFPAEVRDDIRALKEKTCAR